MKFKGPKTPPNVGIKGKTPEMHHAGAHNPMVKVPSGDGVKGGKDQMLSGTRPQANFGKTGTGDPTGSYGSNANVKQGKYHS